MLAARKAILESWKQSGRLPGAQRSRQHSEFATAPPSPQLLDEAKIYAQAFQMPPERAIKHLTEKGNEITWSWRDMDAKAHQKAFTVAKVLTMDVLQMIRGNLEAAQKDGIPFEQFKKNLQPMLEESGWWGKKQVENPNTGKKEEVQLGSAWRLETIYRTNMATARAQGRYKQQKESAKFLPYLEYVQIDRANKRDEHAKLAGKIFRADDPIWQRIYPPRGFNCGCSVQARSQKWMDRNGRQVDNSKELADWEPDEGWDFNPEEDWKPDTSKYDQDIVAEFEQLTPPTFQPWGNSTLTPLSMVPPAPPEPQKATASKPKAPKKTSTISQSTITDALDENGFRSAYETGVVRPPLDLAESAGIFAYTENSYLQLNNELRLGKVSKTSSALKTIINTALDKLPAHQGVVYRGIAASTQDEFDELVQRYVAGAVIEEKMFLSTSINEKVALNFRSESKTQYGVFMTILSNNGKRIESFSYAEELGIKEAEVLFKTDSKFTVGSANIKDNVLYLILEEQ